MQLQLYPANLTKEQFASGQSAISFLPLALGPKVNQKINGDWSLQFEYPAGYAIRPDMLVLADGQLYRITEVEPEGVKTTVRALHLFYDLRDRMIVNIETAETTPGGINQKTALQQVLNGSTFEAGEVDTDLVLDYLDILQKDAVWAIKEQVLGFWGGEIQIDNWTINIRKKMGADKGVQLRHGKNIKGIRYSESLDGVITRLHILGYRNANIESINDGKDYIDSPNIGLYANIKEGLVTFSDDDLPEDLLSKGIEYLATVDTPRVTVSVDMAKVLTSVQFEHYADLERMELGDTVRIIHPMGVNIETRVTSREYDPVTGENIRVEYSNESKNLYASIASAQQASEIIKMITDRKGHIRGEQLRGMVDLLTTRLYASGSYNVAEVRENEGMLFENTDEESVDYGALFIGPGLFAIASAKDENGSWVWRTFGTGQGFVADEIVAGVLQASLVKILGTDHFYWDKDNIVVSDPGNALRQIRYGRYDGVNYGIGLTEDGGITWNIALGFDGLNLSDNTDYQALSGRVDDAEQSVRDIFDDGKITPDERYRMLRDWGWMSDEHLALTRLAEDSKPDMPGMDAPQDEAAFYAAYNTAVLGCAEAFPTADSYMRALADVEGDEVVAAEEMRDTINSYLESVLALRGLIAEADKRRMGRVESGLDEERTERLTRKRYMNLGKFISPEGAATHGLLVGEDVDQLDAQGNVITTDKVMSVTTATEYALLVNREKVSYIDAAGTHTKAVDIGGYWEETTTPTGGYIKKWIGGGE